MIHSKFKLIQNSRHSKYHESLKYNLHRTMYNKYWHIYNPCIFKP